VPMRTVGMRPFRTATALAITAFALLAGQAHAVTLVLPDGTQRPQPYQAWVDAARVPAPPGLVTLQLAPCPVGGSAGGCVIRGRSEIFLAPESRDRRTLLHELGHVFDQSVMSRSARARFQSLVRRRGAWAAAAGGDSAEEQFAEAYALCAQRTRLTDTHFGMYDYTPTPRRHARACRIIRAAAAAAR
jgi:hypothetical protein